VVWKTEQYAILSRDEFDLHLNRAEEGVLDKVRGQLSFYLEVDGIAGIWEHVKAFKNQYKVRDLFDRPYGMREFHILDPDGCLVFVGEELPSATQ
jgi:hypothetical protein